MKILIFAPFYPPHIGGVENYTQELADELSKRGVHLLIFTPHIPDSSPAHETIGTIEVVRFPAFEIIRNYPLPKFWSGKFWKPFLGLWKQSFDVTISETRFFITSLLAMVYAKTKKTTWAHIEHGSSFVQTSDLLVSLFARMYDLAFGKLILNSANQIIAISESVKKFIETLAPKRQARVIYRGFDFEKIESIEPNMALKEQYKNDRIVIFIGRLVSGKGVADLLKAFSQSKQSETSGVKLFIVGNGPEKVNLETESKELGIYEDVIFFGSRSRKETISILKIADVFVNPSYSEGLPTTVMEAVACKVPIIATNVGGTTEIIRKESEGIIIPPASKNEIKRSITRLLEHPEIAKSFSNAAYDAVRRRFSWKECTDEFIEEFRK